ncbi:unnamed protein product [Calypogeia fissa]
MCDRDCLVFCSTTDETDQINAYASNIYSVVTGLVFDDEGDLEDASSGGHITAAAITLQANDEDDDWEPSLSPRTKTSDILVGSPPQRISVRSNLASGIVLSTQLSIRSESVGTRDEKLDISAWSPAPGSFATPSRQLSHGSEGSRRSGLTPRSSTPQSSPPLLQQSPRASWSTPQSSQHYQGMPAQHLTPLAQRSPHIHYRHQTHGINLNQSPASTFNLSESGSGFV